MSTSKYMTPHNTGGYEGMSSPSDRLSIGIDIRDTLLSAEREFDEAFKNRWAHLKDTPTEILEKYEEALSSFLKHLRTSTEGYDAWEREAATQPRIGEVLKEEKKEAFTKKWLAVSVASYLGSIALFFAEKNTPGVLAFLGGTAAMGTIAVGHMLEVYEPAYAEVFNRRLALLDVFSAELRTEIHRRKNIRV